MRSRLVSVIGGSECTADESELAQEVGRLTARKAVALALGIQG